MKGRMKQKMKRREKKEKMIFSKKLFQNPQTRQMNRPKMSQKKNPFGRIIPPFFFESSESDRFYNYLHDSNSIFRAPGINSEWVSGGTVLFKRTTATLLMSKFGQSFSRYHLDCSCSSDPCTLAASTSRPRQQPVRRAAVKCINLLLVPLLLLRRGRRCSRWKACWANPLPWKLPWSMSVFRGLRLVTVLDRDQEACNGLYVVAWSNCQTPNVSGTSRSTMPSTSTSPRFA